MDGDIIMHKLKNDGSVRAAWINGKIKTRKEVIQEIFYAL